MILLRQGSVTAAVIGLMWAFVMAITVSVALSFASGLGFRPGTFGCVALGLGAGLALIYVRDIRLVSAAFVVLSLVLVFTPISPILFRDGVPVIWQLLAAAAFGVFTVWPLSRMLVEAHPGALTRHAFEDTVIKFLTGFGFIVFTAAVLIPFYVMVMTSLKSQQALLKNPLDFSLDLSRGMDLFRSYFELFGQFNFGSYTSRLNI